MTGGILAVMSPSIRAVLALLLLAGGCWGGEPGEGALQVVRGQVEQPVDERWVDVQQVALGVAFRTVEPTLLTTGADDVWLPADSEAVVADGVVTLRRGAAVLDGNDLVVAVGDAVVEGVGAFRVDAGVTPRVGLYRGTVEVRRPGEGYRLEPYRQISLTSRRFDGLDDPLAYDAGDAADQRYLAKAISFDAEVARYSARLAELYGQALQPPSFYAAFAEVDPGEVGVLTQAAPSTDAAGNVGPPAEALIGLFVARTLAQAQGLDPQEAASRVAGLRQEGARWGLIAAALDLGDIAFGATVDQAVAAAVDVVAVAEPAPAPAAPAPAPAGPDDGAPDTPTSTPPTTPPPADPPSDPPGEPGLLDPVTELLGEVLDILPDGGLVGGVGGTVENLLGVE